jgi:cytochrome P450
MAQPKVPRGPRLGVRHAWSRIYRPRRYYAWLRRRYGEIVALQAPSPAVIVLAPEGARQVLTKDPDTYDAFHREAFTGLAGVGSIWVLDGERHRDERRTLLPRFSAHQCRLYGQAIREIALRHTDAWHTGQAINAYDAMLDISLDVILRVMFGAERGGAIDDGRRVLKKLLPTVSPLIVFVPAFQVWWFPPWVRYQRTKREFSMFVMRLLAERRRRGNDSGDVLSLMLSARYENGAPIGDNEIRDELLTIVTAGHETTAVALAWALYELGRHPAVLRRLREELERLGRHAAPDLIVKQPYLVAVCDETLRLHTILAEVGRNTRVPCELLGYQLPAGTGIVVCISAIHHDPLLYPEPDVFRPERLLERRYSAFEFLPFGGGHRHCLGAALSDYEMRIVLATIVMRWELEVIGEEEEIRHNIGTGPKYGVRMRVRGPLRPAIPPAAGMG